MYSKTRPVPEPYEPLLLKAVHAEMAAGTAPAEVGPDEFPVFESDPLAAQHRHVSRFMADGLAKFPGRRSFPVREVECGPEILGTDGPGRFAYLLATVARELWAWKRWVRRVMKPLNGWEIQMDEKLYPLGSLPKALLRDLAGPVDQAALMQLLDAATLERLGKEVRRYVPWEKLVELIVATCGAAGAQGEMRKWVVKLREQVMPGRYDYGNDLRVKREMVEQLDGLLSPRGKKLKLPIDMGEPWADAAVEMLAGQKGATWTALLEYAGEADGAQPTQKWLKGGKPLVQAVGTEAFEKEMEEWLELALKPRTKPLLDEQMRLTAYGMTEDVDLYAPRNEAVLKGLVWIAGAMDRGSLASGIGMLAERCYKKIPKFGPRSVKVGNACLAALTMMSGREAAGQLSRLKAIVKQSTGRTMVEKALARLADRQGVTVEDLEENAVPKFGLVEGVTERKFGDVTLRISMTPLAEVEQAWTDGEGKARKAAPASVKSEHGEALRAVKRELMDLDKTLTAQRLRLERLFLRRTPWAFEAWAEAYHEHPLVRLFARRLIWSFAADGKDVAAGWDGKRFVNAGDEPVKIEAGTQVRLWHPSTSSSEEVLAWRRWLEKHEITQPFKQAHREIYLLTDAERRTATYSNRFAQHIVRQHQFQALCHQRGWKYHLMGAFGSQNYPTLELPTWGTTVQFWVDIAPESPMAASGIAMYLTTDQMRFFEGGRAGPQRLEAVPTLLLSEVFRDVDLFVAVTSVGNDPNWQDGGQDGGYQAYWHEASFGELSATAQTRRAVLESLMPRLTKLKGKWSLADRFLIIKGSKRTYKIHLGSGNILMEPNDQYLCIVPEVSKGKDPGVFLPFEGDRTLSIILSKAFLLEEDAKIADETILRQIRH